MLRGNPGTKDASGGRNASQWFGVSLVLPSAKGFHNASPSTSDLESDAPSILEAKRTTASAALCPASSIWMFLSSVLIEIVGPDACSYLV